MARDKKGAAKAKAPAAKRPTTSRREIVEPEEEAPTDDPVALGMILMTAVALVAALIVTLINLGGYGVGPFAS